MTFPTMYTGQTDRWMNSPIMIPYPDAHDAAADIEMTIQVMRWARTQARKRAPV